MADQYVGQDVTVRGERYRITGIRHCGSSGAKFFGKFHFTLRRASDGAMFSAFGKAVAHNSRLSEVSPAELERDRAAQQAESAGRLARYARGDVGYRLLG